MMEQNILLQRKTIRYVGPLEKDMVFFHENLEGIWQFRELLIWQ